MTDAEKKQVIDGLLKNVERVASGEFHGFVIYGASVTGGATFQVLGQVGVDDLCICASRATLASHEMFRKREQYVLDPEPPLRKS